MSADRAIVKSFGLLSTNAKFFHSPVPWDPARATLERE